MKTIWLMTLALLASPLASAEDFIFKPILRAPEGENIACLQGLIADRVLAPGQSVVEWRGPGMKADQGGVVDDSVAAYVFTTENPTGNYALLFLTADGDGWRYFSYQQDGRVKLGVRAKSLYRIAKLIEVRPHGRELPSLEIPTLDIDLMPCADSLSR